MSIRVSELKELKENERKWVWGLPPQSSHLCMGPIIQHNVYSAANQQLNKQLISHPLPPNDVLTNSDSRDSLPTLICSTLRQRPDESLLQRKVRLEGGSVPHCFPSGTLVRLVHMLCIDHSWTTFGFRPMYSICNSRFTFNYSDMLVLSLSVS